MFLIAGLGNPGKEYENTRHNIGFMVADAIRSYHGFMAPKLKFHGEISEGYIAGQRVSLFKPLTYMNLSGNSVARAAQFLKVPLDKIIVIHDDLDLAVGKVRVKTGGGSGGHNGLKDIDARLGKDYQRIRIGIGRPGDRDDVANYVLHKFSKDERVVMYSLQKNIAEYIGLYLDDKSDLFMTRVIAI